jgi:hypothetical protein
MTSREVAQAIAAATSRADGGPHKGGGSSGSKIADWGKLFPKANLCNFS